MKDELRAEFNECGCGVLWDAIYDLDIASSDYIIGECLRRADAIARADDASKAELALVAMVDSWE